MLDGSQLDDRAPASPRTRRLSVRHALWLAAALGALCTHPQRAHAETTIAGDLDFDVPVSTDYAKTGGGFGIRVGQQFHVPLLVVNPEIGFTYATFGNHGQSEYKGPTVYRGIAGLRLGVGEVLRFGLLAHIGFGYVSFDVPKPLDSGYVRFSFDAGVFLDLTLLPLLNLGVHIIYDQVAGKDNLDPTRWMQLGAHAALVF